MAHRYTPHQKFFIKHGFKKWALPELTRRFNAFFDTDLSETKIRAVTSNNGYKSGRTGQFEKGHIPHNKGKKGLYPGGVETQFKPGHSPKNVLPLYHERITKDGYVEIKVPETNPYTGHPTRFRLKHKWLWEQENGPVPDGHCLVFRDGDKTNCRLENLTLMKRAEAMLLNSEKAIGGYGDAPAELKKTMRGLARLQHKISSVGVK